MFDVKEPKSGTDMNKSQISSLDHIWQYLIKVAAGWRCEICGSTNNGLHAAHIIGRGALWTRWRERNGLALCVECHVDAKIKAWLIAENWRKGSKYRYRWNWIVAQKRKIHYSSRPEYKNEKRRLIRKYRTAA